MALAHAIMTALIDDDLSGYELARSFDSSFGFFWQASHQQIYQELRKLADRKWLNRREVSQQGKPNKIIYGLTRAGREALSDWVYQAAKRPAAKDDLLIKLYNVSEENAAHLIGELTSRREEAMQRLYLFETIRRQHYDDPDSLPTRRKGVYLALRAGIGAGEQYMQWCDEALAMLASISPSSGEPGTD